MIMYEQGLYEFKAAEYICERPLVLQTQLLNCAAFCTESSQYKNISSQCGKIIQMRFLLLCVPD
jgi:hypothetical protein